MIELLHMPSFHHEGEDDSPARLKILSAKMFAKSSAPDERRRAGIARVLINLENDPLVWDRMVEDHGDPLEES